MEVVWNISRIRDNQWESRITTLNLTLNLIPHKSNQKWAHIRDWLARSHYFG